MEASVKHLTRVGEAILCFLMICLVGLAFVQVVLRYVFNGSLFWAEEVILFTFTWLIFVASAINLERGAHFGVDLLVNCLPRVGRRTIQGATQLGIGVILCVFIWVGVRFTVGAWVQESEILRVPMSFLYASLPLAACVMLLVVIRNVVVLLRRRPLHIEMKGL